MASIDGEVRASDVGLAVILVIQIATLFVVAPLAATEAASSRLIEVLRLVLAVVTILIVARRGLTRGLIAAAFLATLVATLAPPEGRTPVAILIARTAVTMAFDLIVAGMVAVAAFGPGRITVHRILGGVILYLYFGLIFAGVYRVLTLVVPDGFSGLPAGGHAQFDGLLYFSFGALTTSSSGDLVAHHPVVRSVAALEAVIGQLYPVTLLGRLVTMHTAAHMTVGERD